MISGDDLFGILDGALAEYDTLLTQYEIESGQDNAA